MCGIWGIMSRNNSSLFKTDLKPVKTLMTLTSLRGGHGCGMLGINKLPTDKIPISWVKAAADFHEFLRYPETIQFFKDFETPYAIFGHDRYATRGSIITENAHPFEKGDITLLHNGSVWTGLTLKKDQTDSERICELVNENGVEETFSKLDGAFVCVWLNRKDHTLNIIKNDKRPLYYMDNSFVRFFASEAIFLEVLKLREFTEYAQKNLEIKPVENWIWHKWEAETGKYTSQPVKKYIPPVQTYHHTSHHGQEKTTTYIDSYNKYYSTLNLLKGKTCSFFIERREADGTYKHAHQVYYGMTFDSSDTLVGDEIPIMFRTNDTSKWDPLMNQHLQGKIIGIEKIKNKQILLIKTSTIEQITEDQKNPKIEEDADDPVEFVQLFNGDSITEEEFITASQENCYHCGSPLSIDEAEGIALNKLSIGKITLICPDCVNTYQFFQKFNDTTPIHTLQ